MSIIIIISIHCIHSPHVSYLKPAHTRHGLAAKRNIERQLPDSKVLDEIEASDAKVQGLQADRYSQICGSVQGWKQ